MKAIIPVAGVGTKLRPLTYTQPKPLIPVAGKPIVAIIIDQLKAIGVKEFVFVIGYLGEKIRDYVEETFPDLEKTFIYQQERRGSGHAVWTAREAIKDVDELLIFFGDTILDMDFEMFKNEPNTCLAVKKVNDPRDFGVVTLNEELEVIKLVEKPRIPKSNLAMVGFYKVTDVPGLLKGLQHNIENDIKSGDEFPLTDAFMYMVNNGTKITTQKVSNWFDCGKREVLLETNAILLERESYGSENMPVFDNSIIIHPVSIGKNCDITDSIIGPHVTIGDNAKITSTIIKDSIVGNYASLEGVVLKQSVIGNDTMIRGGGQSLNIGDNTEIDFT